MSPRDWITLGWHTLIQHELISMISGADIRYFCECGKRWPKR